MALKVAIAAGGAAKAVFRPALLCRPWEVLGANEAPRRSISSVSTSLGCVYVHMRIYMRGGELCSCVSMCIQVRRCACMWRVCARAHAHIMCMRLCVLCVCMTVLLPGPPVLPSEAQSPEVTHTSPLICDRYSPQGNEPNSLVTALFL